MAETKLKNQSLDTTTRLSSKMIAATRNMTADSGDVSYTGVGFTPTAIIILAVIDGSYTFSIGMFDSTRTGKAIDQFANNTLELDANMYIWKDGSNYQKLVIKSYDADGFTITWTKGVLPTGTANMSFLCFR